MIDTLKDIESCVAHAAEIEISLKTKITLALVTKLKLTSDEVMDILEEAAVSLCDQADDELHTLDLSKNYPHTSILAINEDCGYDITPIWVGDTLPKNIKEQLVRKLACQKTQKTL